MSDAAANSSEPRPSRHPSVAHTSGLRRLIDSLVCLALAVIVFRTFEVEGYMISTGSMAPSLLGFHKRIVCPACEYEFAVGVAYDEDHEAGAARDFTAENGHAACPNCGQGRIDVSLVPRNQGDQLLVHKNAFQVYRPRRWEVVVFRNPYKPTQAYVKRIVGLPFETVEIRDGDVYVDGAIQRKDLTSQRAVRINVFDQDFEPRADPDWQPRWSPQADGEARWQADGHGFVLRDAGRPAAGELDPFAWVAYRHWIRSGGTHETALPMPELRRSLERSTALLPLRYDPDTRRLSCVGVLSDAARDQLLAVADDPRLRDAIGQLAAESHFAPITDDYGYNRTRNGVPAARVRDLMLAAEVHIQHGEGQFAMELTDGNGRVRLVLDAGRGRAGLFVDDAAEPVSEAALETPLVGRPVLVEMSLFDRQVLVALDGKLALPAWTMPDDRGARLPGDHRALRQPARFGAAALNVRVDSLKLFRDVYYTPKGDPTPVRLGEGEYFVLGDNSPLSLDSRRWEEPAVPRRLFLGKPFVVHLPSKQATVRIGSTARHIRIPDLARVRYIR
ncbi:MAG TPA: signal peptidase I [Planctomycetaceae bacterium]|nr:signal peptidase I [Planctomycetaceae bacterium]